MSRSMVIGGTHAVGISTGPANATIQAVDLRIDVPTVVPIHTISISARRQPKKGLALQKPTILINNKTSNKECINLFVI